MSLSLDAGLEPGEFDRMRNAEDRHWWYLGMADISRHLLDRWNQPPESLRILDAGCGTGGAASSFLPAYGTVTGLDLSPLALRHCRSRGSGRWTGGSVQRLPFADEAFDLVTCFDVLYAETVPSEREALAEFRRVLVPGGKLLLRVPALPWMRRAHDAVVRTRRRFTRREVGELMIAAGFRPEVCAYANFLLFPAALAKSALDRIFPPRCPRSDLELDWGAWNPLLARLLALEGSWISRGWTPIGLSVVAAGEKA
jgi:SAM-dependent methyltransferase